MPSPPVAFLPFYVYDPQAMLTNYLLVLLLLIMILIAISYTPRGFLLPGIGLAVKLTNLISRVVSVPYDPVVRRKITENNVGLAAIPPHGKITATDTVISLPDRSIKARRYLPKKSNGKNVILYFHGGGYVLGSIDMMDPLVRAIALGTESETWSIGYRLAPEHPFPAALDDAFASYASLVSEFHERKDIPDLYVAGDSAGAHLAVTLCLKLRREGLPLPAGQILFYPVTDFCTFTTESYRMFEKGFVLGKRDMEWFRDLLLPGNCPDSFDPLISPLRAEDLAGLPRALVITAEFDVLRDEGETFAMKLAEHGVKTELVRFRGLVHGFLGMSRFSTAGRRAIKIAARFIRKGTT